MSDFSRSKNFTYKLKLQFLSKIYSWPVVVVDVTVAARKTSLFGDKCWISSPLALRGCNMMLSGYITLVRIFGPPCLVVCCGKIICWKRFIWFGGIWLIIVLLFNCWWICWGDLTINCWGWDCWRFILLLIDVLGTCGGNWMRWVVVFSSWFWWCSWICFICCCCIWCGWIDCWASWAEFFWNYF